ncbi:hypothetical protein AMTRI_Chr06g175190 [Amborella trichopoda]
MDALKEFSIDPLNWGLHNVIEAGDSVTILGVMPWLNLPLSCKTWLDIWRLDFENWSELIEKSEWKTDNKHQKLRAVIKLCKFHKVVPRMERVMGCPLRLLVAERASSLHAAHMRGDRGDRAFYAKKMPSSVLMMTNNGEADIIKVISKLNHFTPDSSPAMPPLTAEIKISREWSQLLKQKKRERESRSLEIIDERDDGDETE